MEETFPELDYLDHNKILALHLMDSLGNVGSRQLEVAAQVPNSKLNLNHQLQPELLWLASNNNVKALYLGRHNPFRSPSLP